MGERRNPYIAVIAVWIVSSCGLSLAISFPILFVILSLLLVIIGCIAYKARHRHLNNQDLPQNVLSALQRSAIEILNDFKIVFNQVAAWWLQREAQVQQEIAQERERRERKREKLAQLEHKRRARRVSEYPTTGEHEDVRRSSHKKRNER